MTIYAMHDVGAVTVPDGCGQTHTVTNGSLTCAPCEPILLTKDKQGLGWASDPLSVKLTPDEMLQAQAQEKEGQRAQALAAQALGRQIADTMRAPALTGAATGADSDFVGRLASGLSAAEIDVLRKIVAQASGAVPAGADGPVGTAAVSAPPKRGPGRPRKNPLPEAASSTGPAPAADTPASTSAVATDAGAASGPAAG